MKHTARKHFIADLDRETFERQTRIRSSDYDQLKQTRFRVADGTVNGEIGNPAPGFVLGKTVDEGSDEFELPLDKILIAGRLGRQPETLFGALLIFRSIGGAARWHKGAIKDVPVLHAINENKEWTPDVKRPLISFVVRTGSFVIYCWVGKQLIR